MEFKESRKVESRAKRVHPLFNNRFKGRSTEEGEEKEEEEEEERWKDGGVGWRAGIFALRYVVARLISRIPGKGACDRGKKEKRIRLDFRIPKKDGGF